MKRYLVRVRPMQGPAFHYTQEAPDAFEAMAWGQQVTGGLGRITVRVLK